MNRIQFGEGGCAKTRKYLDSYISNELMVETNHEVLKHVEGCAACAAELDARSRLRNQLRAAVSMQTAPPYLQGKVREQIRRNQNAGNRLSAWMPMGWPRWAAATALTVLVCGGIAVKYSTERLPALTDRPAQNAYVSKISANLASVLRVGLGDHVHCAIFRKYPKQPPTPEKMEADLGPAYSGLLPVVHAAIPEGYRVVLAHQCSYAGRKFVHLTFEKNGELLSLVVAKKEAGESLSAQQGLTDIDGISIAQSSAGRYQVAGFEAGKFFAYVVSDLKANSNLQIAEAVAPRVHAFLMKVPA